MKRIKKAHDKIEKIESAIWDDMEKELVKELHEIFDWWIEKFPKRKNDLEFWSGMGIAEWRIKNYKCWYIGDVSDWVYNEEVTINPYFEKLYNFFEKVHAIGEKIHNGYPMDIGSHSSRNYILEKENTNPNK